MFRFFGGTGHGERKKRQLNSGEEVKVVSCAHLNSLTCWNCINLLPMHVGWACGGTELGLFFLLRHDTNALRIPCVRLCWPPSCIIFHAEQPKIVHEQENIKARVLPWGGRSPIIAWLIESVTKVGASTNHFTELCALNYARRVKSKNTIDFFLPAPMVRRWRIVHVPLNLHARKSEKDFLK